MQLAVVQVRSYQSQYFRIYFEYQILYEYAQELQRGTVKSKALYG